MGWGKLDVAGVAVQMFLVITLVIWGGAGGFFFAMFLAVPLWALIRAVRQRNRILRGDVDPVQAGISGLFDAAAERIRGGQGQTTIPRQSEHGQGPQPHQEQQREPGGASHLRRPPQEEE